MHIIYLLAALSLVGCQKTYYERGKFIDEQSLTRLVPGKSTATKCLQILGSPSLIPEGLDKNTWIYHGSLYRNIIVDKDRMIKCYTIVLIFDKTNILQEIKTFSDMRNLNISLNATEAKELEPNAFKDLFLSWLKVQKTKNSRD